MIALIRKSIMSYPFALLTPLFSIIAACHFQMSLQTGAACILIGGLVTLALVDFKYCYLPDIITLPFLWIGLLFSLGNVFQTSESCILGAVCGYLSLWVVYKLFKYLTGKEGMGYGDFKLLSMLGAWLGLEAIPLIILIASLLGALVGISLVLLRKRHKDTPLPFGPYLAIAGFITLLWQADIVRFYLHFLL